MLPISNFIQIAVATKVVASSGAIFPYTNKKSVTEYPTSFWSPCQASLH